MQKAQLLFEGEVTALKKTPVESFPVEAVKKLSIAQVVGDFSLIPTTAMDLLSLVSNLDEIKIPTGTKSAKKGWRLTAKW